MNRDSKMNIGLSESLKALRLPLMSEKYADIAQRCAIEKLGHVEYIKLLVDMEIEQRHHKKIKTLIKKSRIPRVKSIRDFKTDRLQGITNQTLNDLAKGEFIDRAENLLIFGNPGTGKTHLSIALTQEWCSLGYKTLFVTAAELTQDLRKAKNEMNWNKKIESLNKNDVIVIDDISYIPCERQEADLLFILLASRYENKSIVITSNLQFAQWNTIFKDDITTAAAIDRLVHHSKILTLNADSYRKAIAKQKIEEKLAEQKLETEKLETEKLEAEKPVEQKLTAQHPEEEKLAAPKPEEEKLIGHPEEESLEEINKSNQ